jgi:hypothetical protein
MGPRTIFLSGAPEVESLSWDESGLLKSFTEPVARFLRVSPAEDVTLTPRLTASARVVSWRNLPLSREHLATGHSQNAAWQEEYRGDATFLSTSNLSYASDHDCTSKSWQDGIGDSDLPAEETLSQFYEHSFAVHEDIASSQIPSSSSRDTSNHQVGNDTTASFDSNERSCNTTASSFLTGSPTLSRGPLEEAPTSGHLSDLEDIPNANYLHSIQPQTMTVNLIVGIISISSPRTIKTRRGIDVEIVEVLVGDDTKSGFNINFWLSSNAPGELGNSLAGLRAQDIVLMRHVALSSFQGRVYGQSLRKNLTKVDLLFRTRLDRRDVGGYYTARDLSNADSIHPQMEKARKVREWVLKFVGAGNVRKVDRGKGKAPAYERLSEVLPPDTQ